MLKPQECMKILKEKLELDDDYDCEQRDCFMLIFSLPKYNSVVSFEEICKVFKLLRVTDGRPSDGFDKLDAKGFRILNRLKKLVTSNKISIDKIIKSIEDIPEDEIYSLKYLKLKALYEKFE